MNDVARYEPNRIVNRGKKSKGEEKEAKINAPTLPLRRKSLHPKPGNGRERPRPLPGKGEGKGGA